MICSSASYMGSALKLGSLFEFLKGILRVSTAVFVNWGCLSVAESINSKRAKLSNRQGVTVSKTV